MIKINNVMMGKFISSLFNSLGPAYESISIFLHSGEMPIVDASYSATTTSSRATETYLAEVSVVRSTILSVANVIKYTSTDPTIRKPFSVKKNGTATWFAIFDEANRCRFIGNVTDDANGSAQLYISTLEISTTEPCYLYEMAFGLNLA